MKKAYQYIRISMKDQSNWSINGQIETNERYAKSHNINIVKTFIDDGKSAKNFDRPEWIKLEKQLKKNRAQVDYLIVTKYDRLTRNVSEGLAMIELIEIKLGIRVLSVNENISIDPHSPFFFKIRADMLVNAEFERRVISDRSKFGTWQAKSQGRFVGQAPFGYLNARDDRNKPIIVVDSSKAHIINEIFKEFVAGLSLSHIKKNARERGFTRKGNVAIKRILSNPVYAGYVVVPAYKDNAEKIIRGIHEAIVSEVTFHKAQEKLVGKPQPKLLNNDHLPLRSIICCQHCGKLMTGARSLNKAKKYYHYYRCNPCKEYYRNTYTHNELIEVLGQLSLEKEYLLMTKQMIQKGVNEQSKSREKQLKNVRREITKLSELVDNVEEKYISGKIGDETYRKWHGIYTRDLQGKKVELLELEDDKTEIKRNFLKHMDLLKDLPSLYQKSDFTGKQLFIRCLFPDKFIKLNTGFGTPSINPLFNHNIIDVQGITITDQLKNGTLLSKNPISTRNGFVIEHLVNFFEHRKIG